MLKESKRKASKGLDIKMPLSAIAALENSKVKKDISKISPEKLTIIRYNIELANSVYVKFKDIHKSLLLNGPENSQLRKYFDVSLKGMKMGGVADDKVHKDNIVSNLKNFSDLTNMDIISILFTNSKDLEKMVIENRPLKTNEEVRYTENKLSVLNQFIIWYLENRKDVICVPS